MDNITPTPEQVTQVAAILRTENVTEAGGEWSAFDVGRVLDPDAHTPASMFDTGGPYPSNEWCAIARAAIDQIGVSGRYVGGTSGHLYHLPPLGRYSVEVLPRPNDHPERFAVIREHDGARSVYRAERTRKDAQHCADHFNAGQPSEALSTGGRITAWDAEADPCPHGNAIGTRCGTCDGPAGAADHQPRETDR